MLVYISYYPGAQERACDGYGMRVATAGLYVVSSSCVSDACTGRYRCTFSCSCMYAAMVFGYDNKGVLLMGGREGDKRDVYIDIDINVYTWGTSVRSVYPCTPASASCIRSDTIHRALLQTPPQYAGDTKILLASNEGYKKDPRVQ